MRHHAETEAWMKYLRLTRQRTREESYEEVESWAWAQLQATLRKVHREREKSHA